MWEIKSLIEVILYLSNFIYHQGMCPLGSNCPHSSLSSAFYLMSLANYLNFRLDFLSYKMSVIVSFHREVRFKAWVVREG